MSALVGRLSLPRRLPRLAIAPGISAIMVKELRGRMRGRRAFIVLTIHVLILAGLAWMFQRIQEQQFESFSSYNGQATYASASIGRSIFYGLMMVQTLMVAVLAPAATAGAISSEREHQTLELLAVTPISSLAIVLGKLLSALAWVFVLVLASIPVTALVFVFGGVAPDDMVRGYAVLFATVIGLGSVGIFFSALTRRTGASTGLTFVTTLVLVIGSIFFWVYLSSTAETSSTGLRKQPSEAILYLNPFVAQTDVACGTEAGSYGGSCSTMSSILGPTDIIPTDNLPPDMFPTKPAPGIGIGGGGVAFPRGPGLIIVDDGSGAAERAGSTVNIDPKPGFLLDTGADLRAVAQADPFHDRFWPKTVISFLVLATVLTLASVQFVTPTRRWRPSLPGPVRRLIRRRSAS